mmetsp:Transcript_25587/g.36040  ORF Transcript_25587/g.36040 Transcript_25587/m.36040 type:complete len:97 (+) Transcript_25587:123-413(+)
MSPNEQQAAVQKLATALESMTPRVDEIVAKSESVGTEIEASEESIKQSTQVLSKRMEEIEELQTRLKQMEQSVQENQINISKLEAANTDQLKTLDS